MRVVLQRVKEARVLIDGEKVGEIGEGILVFLGVSNDDTEKTADKMADKIIKLRIFEDENGKINRSLMDVGGSLLVVSQFTLYADCKNGNRPGFTKAGDPEKAEPLYEYFVKHCRQTVPVVQHGVFGAHMEVELINDGPFTFMLEGDENGIKQDL